MISPSFGQTSHAKDHAQSIVKAGDYVTLSGAGINPDDDLVIEWKQTGGEKVTLSSTAVSEPTFTAPDVKNGRVKILTFELSVTDRGTTQNTTIKITVIPRNQLPTANAGSDQSVSKNDRVTLRGNGSDQNGDVLLYRWSQVNGPTIKLSDVNDQNPSFDTSTLTRSSAVLRFQLTVSDGYGGVARDSVVIKVNAAKTALISAHAGDDQFVDEGTNIQLDGSCDYSLDREFSHTWTQTLGPSVRLSSTTRADPIFTAPEIPNGKTVPIAFRFTCLVEGGGTSTDVVIIRVSPMALSNLRGD
ncbi:MAG: Peptidase [Candidatus Nitrosotenuis sp.]|nr:Peptidase [Candidatus Nitrosotenuis sp.]